MESDVPVRTAAEPLAFGNGHWDFGSLARDIAGLAVTADTFVSSVARWLETPFLVFLAPQECCELLNVFFLSSLLSYFVSQNCLLWVATKNSGKYKNGHLRLW